MASVVQRSFAAGEISGQMAGRADQVKRATGLRTCRNFIATRTGSVINRAGTELVAFVKDSTKRTRAMKFIFANDDTYLLEFGNLYIRWYRNDDQVQPDLPFVAWVTATAYTIGTMRTRGPFMYVCILAHTSGATDEPGVGVNWQTYWYAQSGTITGNGWSGTMEWPSPYLEADLFDITCVQQGDVVTLCHPSYPPRELKRYASDRWELATIAFSPSLLPPTAISATGSAGGKTLHYVVTAVTGEGEESVSGTATVAAGTQATITAITLNLNSEVLITCGGGHPFTNGQEVRITGLAGTIQLNNRNFVLTVLSGTQFRLRGERYRLIFSKYTTHFPYAGGGLATVTNTTIVNFAEPSDSTPVRVSWTAADGALEYNVYRKKNGVYGFVGATRDVTFVDDGIVPDVSTTAPVDKAPFVSEGNYPSAVAYFQQRQLFANTIANPEKVWPSQVGSYHNHSARAPALDDDAFQFTIAGQKLNRVRHMIDIGKLVLFTEGGEWTVQGDSDGVLRPTAINLHQEGYSGIWKVAPIVIGNAAVFVSGRGNSVKALRYDFATDGFPSNDLTIYARHLFDGYTITDWDFALSPFGVVWAVRSDGTLLGLTLLPEQDVVAWHRHDTGADDGDTFESVACLPDGIDDSVYVIVKRTIDGVTTRAIEKFASRSIETVAEDAVFVDRATRVDGFTNAAHLANVTLTGGTTWEAGETLTLTESSGGAGLGAEQFYDQDGYVLTDGTDTVYLRYLSTVGNDVVTVTPVSQVPASLRGVAVAAGSWGFAYASATLSGLTGRTVSLLADGSVMGPYPGGTVVSFLPDLVARYTYGLPIEADVELLDLEDPQGVTLLNRHKLTVEASLQVHATRGVTAGPDEDHLEEHIQRLDEDWDEDTDLATGVIDLQLNASWNNHGRVLIRQSDPLPIELLAAVRRVETGGR